MEIIDTRVYLLDENNHELEIDVSLLQRGWFTATNLDLGCDQELTQEQVDLAKKIYEEELQVRGWNPNDMEELVSDSNFLKCLMELQVHEWEHYEEAMEMFDNIGKQRNTNYNRLN